jgi:hypothetical protein
MSSPIVQLRASGMFTNMMVKIGSAIAFHAP